MLKWIRGARLDFRTGVVILILAILAWAMVIYVNARDFVPEELTDTVPAAPR